MINRQFLSARLRLLPGREAVTFAPRPSGSPIAVALAWREPQAARGLHAAGAGPREAETVTWLIPDAELAPTEPKFHDAVTDSAGREHTVIALEQALLGSVWRLTCVRRS